MSSSALRTYLWVVFAYITLIHLAYLGGMWPFKENIFNKSWIEKFSPAYKLVLSILIVLMFIILHAMMAGMSMSSGIEDGYVLLTKG